MRVLVCGGRDYNDYQRLSAALNAVHEKHTITLVIEGGAKGADSLAGKWAEENGVARCVFPANWNKFGKGAGHVRNKNMLTLGLPDVVIAFPGGTGTDNMVKVSREAGLKVWEVDKC